MNPELNSQFLEKIKVVKSQGCEIVDISDARLNKEATFSNSPEAITAVASGGGGAGADFLSSAPAVGGVVNPEAEKKNKNKNKKILKF